MTRCRREKWGMPLGKEGRRANPLLSAQREGRGPAALLVGRGHEAAGAAPWTCPCVSSRVPAHGGGRAASTGAGSDDDKGRRKSSGREGANGGSHGQKRCLGTRRRRQPRYPAGCRAGAPLAGRRGVRTCTPLYVSRASRRGGAEERRGPGHGSPRQEPRQLTGHPHAV